MFWLRNKKTIFSIRTFSLSRFKVPVHPGLMIRDEPYHNRGGGEHSGPVVAGCGGQIEDSIDADQLTC